MFINENDFGKFIKGNEKSFEIIFHQYFKTLVSFAMRHNLKYMEAEDVVIEVFHHIWEIRRDIMSAPALHSLLFLSVRNRSLNINRNIKNRERILQEQFMSKEEEEEEFQDYLIEEEITHILDQAIKNLSRQSKQVVLLSLSGKSMIEIAEEMHLSINSVKTYKLRAIQAIREYLKDYPYLFLLLLMQITTNS